MFRYFLMLLAVVCTPSLARSQVGLTWKLEPGSEFVVEEESHAKQTLIASGNEEPHEVKQLRRVRFKVLKKNEDGSLVLDQRLEKLTLSRDGKETANDILKKLTGTSLKITLKPPRKIMKSEGYDELVKKLAGADKQTADLTRVLLPESSLTATLETLLLFVPDQEVKPRASWKTESTLALGPLGSMRCENLCTLTKAEKDTATIEVTTRGVYAAPPESPALKIPRGSLRFGEARGTFIFDPAAARLRSCELRRVLKGTLGFVTPTANLDMEVRIEQTQQLRLVEPEKKQ